MELLTPLQHRLLEDDYWLALALAQVESIRFLVELTAALARTPVDL